MLLYSDMLKTVRAHELSISENRRLLFIDHLLDEFASHHALNHFHGSLKVGNIFFDDAPELLVQGFTPLSSTGFSDFEHQQRVLQARHEDIRALGTMIYTILTDSNPSTKDKSTVEGLYLSDVILGCWELRWSTVTDIQVAVRIWAEENYSVAEDNLEYWGPDGFWRLVDGDWEFFARP